MEPEELRQRPLDVVADLAERGRIAQHDREDGRRSGAVQQQHAVPRSRGSCSTAPLPHLAPDALRRLGQACGQGARYLGTDSELARRLDEEALAVDERRQRHTPGMATSCAQGRP